MLGDRNECGDVGGGGKRHSDKEENLQKSLRPVVAAGA